MVPQSGNGNSIYSDTHTYIHTCAHGWASHSEWTIFTVQQSFYYCQSGHLDYSVYYSSTAWYLPPMLLMGHLLSCSILTPVQLACKDDCCAFFLHGITIKSFFSFSVVFPFDKWAVMKQDTMQRSTVTLGVAFQYTFLLLKGTLYVICPKCQVNFQSNLKLNLKRI